MPTTFTQLEQQKADLFRQLSQWTDAQRTFRPSDNDWSAVQVLDHLERTETSILARTQQGLLSPHRISIRDRMATSTVHRVFRSDRRVKVPGSASLVLPDPAADLQDIQRRWDQTRRDLQNFLAPLSPAQASVGVFRHPVCGWMSVNGVLEFFSVHIHHHTFQLERIRQQAQ